MIYSLYLVFYKKIGNSNLVAKIICFQNLSIFQVTKFKGAKLNISYEVIVK